MPCAKCEKENNFHSFDFVGRALDTTKIMYTCPLNGKERKATEDSVKDYIEHMDEASIDAWIWCFDCKGIEKLEMPSLKVLKQFTELVQERYKFVLRKVYIININWRMQMMLSMIQPFMKDASKERINVCKSPLELLKVMGPDVVKKVYQQ